MKILIYCQHVLGIGHLFRTLEITRAMQEHQVTLVLGGPPAELNLPGHVRVVQLPGLKMDAEFSELMPVDPDRTLEDIKKERSAKLFSLTREMQPDIIMIELFPFGRNGFSFELLPLLKAVRCGKIRAGKVVCSLRDILVEKKNQTKFEQRVIDRLNSLFDGLLIHGDPSVIGLDATFSRMNDITVPVTYTGYVCEKSTPEEGNALKNEINMQSGEKLILVSAGGGNVGYELLRSSLSAFALLKFPVRMQVFTGPYMGEDEFTILNQQRIPGTRIERFTDNFPAWLAAADLSISMGGYNTTMNVLASGIPAIILPFAQNREQRMRTEKLTRMSNILLVDENNLSPSILTEQISIMIGKDKKTSEILLDGAEKTNEWLTQLAASGI